LAGDEAVQRRITAFWNAIASDYEAHPGNVAAPESAEYEAWVETIRDLLPPAPADVLDIGTGTGFAALIAAAVGHRVTGIDLSEPMLNEARTEAKKRGLEVFFERGDAVSPGFAPESFDAIVCRHLLWTLREPETALRNWRDLLRPSGCVLAIDGHWFGDNQSDDEGAGFVESFYTREVVSNLPVMAARDTEPVVALFERAGFANVEVSFLDRIHALAEEPPGEDPWYVLVACR
jgi:SAM-dependent methyltransferase